MTDGLKPRLDGSTPRTTAPRARRETRERVIGDDAPSNSAAPLPGAGPPLRAAVPPGPRGPTDLAVLHARQHLQVALMQVLPSDDEILVGHMRDAFALLGGRL